MKRYSASDLLKGNQSYYSLVVGIAKRAREIAKDAEGSGEILTEKPVQIAIQQLARGDYKIIETEELRRARNE